MLKNLIFGLPVILITSTAIAQTAPPQAPPTPTVTKPPSPAETALVNALNQNSNAAENAAANGADQLKAAKALQQALGAWLTEHNQLETSLREQITTLETREKTLKEKETSLPATNSPPTPPKK